MSMDRAKELAANKKCSCVCENGILWKVVILDGAEEIWNSSMSKEGYGDIDLLRNIKERVYECK